MESRKIVAVFDSQDAAQAGADSLLGLGISREQVNIIDQSSSELSTQAKTGERGGFWAHVKEMFMPDDDRATLEESLRQGGFVLSATVNDEQADEAVQMLERSGAVDLEERTAQWRDSGWRGASQTRAPDEVETASTDTNAQSIPVVEERLRVGKREVNRGTVRVRSYIVETPVHEQVRLREERVEVERRPVRDATRPVAKGAPDDLLQERTIEVTETAEQAVVGKEAIVTEEVLVRKTAGERVEEIDDTVRQTEVEVDDARGSPATKSTKPTAPRPSRM